MKKLKFLTFIILAFFGSTSPSSASPEIASMFKTGIVHLRPLSRTGYSATHTLRIGGSKTDLGIRSLEIAHQIVPSTHHKLRLDLSHNNLATEDFQQINALIKTNHHIKELDLTSTGLKTCLSSLHAEHLHTSLESLVLQNNLLDQANIDKIFESWQGSQLKEVNISGNTLSDTWFLKQGLKNKNNLRDLHLSNTGLTLSSLKVFSEEIGLSEQIEHLNLSRNNLGDKGSFFLKKLLLNHSSLQTLDLANTGIKDRGALEIIQLLRNPQLRHLNLKENPISLDGLSDVFRIVLSSQPRWAILYVSLPSSS